METWTQMHRCRCTNADADTHAQGPDMHTDTYECTCTCRSKHACRRRHAGMHAESDRQACRQEVMHADTGAGMHSDTGTDMLGSMSR